MSLKPATKFHELRLTASSPAGLTTRLWLDGMELKGVLSYQLTAGLKDATRLEVTLIVDSINADGELLRKLLEDK